MEIANIKGWVKMKLFYGVILFATIVLTGCSASEETQTQPKEKEESKNQTIEVKQLSTDKDVVKKPSILNLTQEQKEEYHKQYEEIVEKVNQKKLGMGSIEVSPIEDFKPEDWVEPKAFEKRIQGLVETFLKEERENLSAMKSDTHPVVSNPNGETTKSEHIYVADKIVLIDVTGSFETKYSEHNNGQTFAGLKNISTRVGENLDTGEWEQTSYKASLMNGGKTYSIRIEGIYHIAGVSFEKEFNIDFSCDKHGNIH